MNEKTLQNDTSLTAGVVDELAQIAAEKEQLNATKRKCELELSGIKTKIRGSYGGGVRLSREQYISLCNRQHALKGQLFDICQKLKPLQERQRELGGVVDSDAADTVATQLVEMRNRWIAFAEDHTRVNSMRMMAAQFARELTDVISEKRLSERKQQPSA